MILPNYLIYCGEAGIEEKIKINPSIFPVSSKIDLCKNGFSFNSVSKIDFRQKTYFFIISAAKNILIWLVFCSLMFRHTHSSGKQRMPL